jgi:hypothetical protein
MILLDHL